MIEGGAQLLLHLIPKQELELHLGIITNYTNQARKLANVMHNGQGQVQVEDGLAHMSNVTSDREQLESTIGDQNRSFVLSYDGSTTM